MKPSRFIVAATLASALAFASTAQAGWWWPFGKKKAATGTDATVTGEVAQKQPTVPHSERRLIDRIDHPDKELVFDPGQSSPFRSSGTFHSGSANVKEFNYVQKFQGKEFTARTFSGDKSFDAADYAGVKTADSKEARETGKWFGTKTTETKEARDADKGYATRDMPGNRAYLGPEAKKLDEAKQGRSTVTAQKQWAWKGDLKPMSNDDLKKTLNKNR